MRVLSADLWEPAPGQVITWDVTPRAGYVATPSALTYNQRNHLLGAHDGEPSVWITAAFDVDGPVDRDALEAAFRDLVAAHPGLRVEAVHRPAPRTVGLVRHAAAALAWRRREGPVTRPDRSTVVLGMDHLHTDAWSTTVVVDELAARYAEHAGEGSPAGSRGSAPTRPAGAAAIVADPADPAAPSGKAAPSDPADVPGPPFVAADDPRLATWHGFLRDCGWALPTFPLPLGVPDGERAPQRTVVRPLADAATADAVAARARSAGASTSAAVLVTLARAVADLGGPATLETLLPVHTRGDAAARRAVGWHTTTVPLRIETGDGADGALAATGKALRAARELAAVPLEQVVETLPGPLRFPRVDIFQVSYLDYRRLPGHAASAGRAAHHVSAATRADDLQVWVSRTDDGIVVRARMPRTPTAVATVDAVLARWSELLTDLAG